METIYRKTIDWRRKCVVGKGEQATGMTAALTGLSCKADSGTYGSFTRSGLSQCIKSQVSHSSCQTTYKPETTSDVSYLGQGEKELDHCSAVQSPLQIKFVFSFPGKWRRKESKLLEVHCEVFTGSDDLREPYHLLMSIHCVLLSLVSTQPSARRF